MATIIMKQEITNVTNLLAHEEEIHSSTHFCQKIELIPFGVIYTYKKQILKEKKSKGFYWDR